MSMKLHKVVTIGGTVYPLISDDVRLVLTSPGKANLKIQASAPVSGVVTIDIGYNDSPLQRHFLGYVERCTTASAVSQVVFCREMTGVLAAPLPLNLRHVDLRTVLDEIHQKTGLRFRVPEQPYAGVKAPFFYSLASGFQAMDSLARVFGIDDFIWQQQGNGEVFVGNWADSFFGSRTPLQLPNGLFDDYQGNQSAMVAALPGLRPGATINNGERVTSVALSGTQMAIKWKM